MKQTEPQQSLTPKQLLNAIIASKDRELLHDWIYVHFHVNIPTKAICNDHCAPFDFFADYIFGLYDFIVVVANRSGGKTMNFGMLDALMSWYQDNTEIATVGAIQFQAQKAYEYFNTFSQEFPFGNNFNNRTMGKTKGINGSEVKVLTGTMSGVNSPHPQLVFLDEIDLMVWQVLQQALSMAQSKDGVRARTVLTSTRKFAGGPMQRMIDTAGDTKAKVYMWCIWEVVEKLPENDPKLLQEIKDTFGASLPAKINESDGYYSWRDTITKYNTLDEDTWATEWICSRPGLQGVIYANSYSDEENQITSDWSPVGRHGYIYLTEDFGYGEGHPDVVLFVWVPPEFDRAVVFDELYMTGLGDEDIWNNINNKLLEYGHHLPDKAAGTTGSIMGWVPDPHNQTAIANRQYRGAKMIEKNEDAKNYIVLNGIGLVQKLFQSGRLMITAKCTNLRTELLSYKKHKNLDGTYSKEPDKKNDHGPDALRYWVVKFYWQIMSHLLNLTDNKELAEAVDKRDRPIVDERPWVPKRSGNNPEIAGVPYNEDKPITAGLGSGEEVF